MKRRTYKVFAGDFETTVYTGQVRTDVWAAALCPLGTEDVTIDGSIEQMFDRLIALKKHCIIYFHNLKFDGSFILDYLIIDKGTRQATKKTGAGDREIDWLENKDMPYNSVKYLISNMGAWYDIVYRTPDGHFLEFRDSLKLFPFTLAQVADAFKTKHKKLEMEYKGLRYPGCPISDSEREYIAADVLVLKEALEFMFAQGHNLLTIGSNCLHEYKSIVGKLQYKFFFPSLENILLDPKLYGASNADAYIRKSYRGGWCYLVKGKERRIYRNGCTVDVNSLYPSVMSSESRCKYPVREPQFWRGDFIPDEARKPNKYYFVRVRTQFRIKDGYLPTIQVKNSLNYKATEYLNTSDIYNPDDGKYYPVYYDNYGVLQPAVVEMTLTCTDWELIQEHYNLYNTVILDGCFFDAQMGVFDEYIDKYSKIKQESKGAMRTLAKLFLNNLYGKMATSTNAAFKVAYEREDDRIGFYAITNVTKPAGYIAVGSAITSYARNFTIRAAQKNYYGVDKPGFIYADTDSLHLDLPPEQLIDVPVHPTKFCHWKIESGWDFARYTRQKTYIEHIVKEDNEPIPEEQQRYLICCAGMPQRCKDIFIACMTGEYNPDEYTETELEYIKAHQDYTIESFDIGLEIIGKLRPVRIPGGVVLEDTTFKMLNV